MVQKSCASWCSLSHYLQGFIFSIHPRWLFGISEPSTVSHCPNHIGTALIFISDLLPKKTMCSLLFLPGPSCRGALNGWELGWKWCRYKQPVVFFSQKNTQIGRVLVNTYITFKKHSSHSHGSVAPIAPFGDFSHIFQGTAFSTSMVKHTESHAVHSPSHQNLRQRPSKGPFEDGIRKEFLKNVSNNLREFCTHKSPHNVWKERINHSHIMLLVWNIFLHIPQKNMINVGKNSSPMEHLGFWKVTAITSDLHA